MANATVAPWLFDDDQIIPVTASGFNSAQAGDWLIFSARWAIPAHDATIGSPAYKVSAAGLAIVQNPTYDTQGVAITNSGFLALRRGVIRVSGSNSATAGTIPIGSHVYPDTTGSGRIGQTGATGVGALWATAPPQGISANPTGAIASGIGILVAHNGGDATAIQYDVAFNLASNVGYF